MMMNGLGSPAIYSTADVDVAGATLVSNLSEGVCIEGNGSIELTDCALTASNMRRNGNAQYYDSVMIYQSMSGDATGTGSAFSMTGGKLESKNGHVFHVTNTSATINLSGVEIANSDADNVLLSIVNDGWRGNPNKACVNASSQTLFGNIIVSSAASSQSSSPSSLTLDLSDGSTFTGKIDDGAGGSNFASVSVTIASGCTWKLTGDSYVSSISGAGSIDYNGHVLTVGSKAYSSGDIDSISSTTLPDDAPSAGSGTSGSVSSAYTIEQFAGTTRFATARMIIEAELELGSYAGAIIVAGDGDKFPDALSAAGLSGVLGYPIVMVQGSALDTENTKALNLLKKGNDDKLLDLVIVGGTSAVSSSVEGALAKWGKVSQRIGGANRYETCALIYEYGKSHGAGWSTDATFMATGENFPDALAIAPYLVKSRSPIVLVPSAARSMADIPAKGRGALFEAKRVVALGGDAVVSKAMLTAATSASAGNKSARLAGSTRYQTAAEVITWELAQGMSVDGCGIATGKNFPDALACGFLLSASNSVLALVDQDNASNNSAVISALESAKTPATKTRAFGGSKAVTPRVRSQVAFALGMKTPATVTRK